MNKPKPKPKNVLCLPSVIFTVLGTIFVTMESAMANYWTEGEFKPRSLQRALYYSAAALVASASARYSEDKEGNLYSPKFLPGKNKVDVYLEQNSEYLEEDEEHIL